MLFFQQWMSCVHLNSFCLDELTSLFAGALLKETLKLIDFRFVIWLFDGDYGRC